MMFFLKPDEPYQENSWVRGPFALWERSERSRHDLSFKLRLFDPFGREVSGLLLAHRRFKCPQAVFDWKKVPCHMFYPGKLYSAIHSFHFDVCGSGQDHCIGILPFGLELVSWGSLGSFLPGLDQHPFSD
jgi:hypothetical protein